MSEGTLDDRYLEWLYKEAVGATRNPNPAKSHWEIARQLYSTRFEWFVRNDDNRAEDGIALREEFIFEEDIQDFEMNDLWLTLDCSMLEMMIALARRVSFNSTGEAGDWFWKFLTTLELDHYSDLRYNSGVKALVKTTVERVIYRRYERNGDGGLFPLQHARKDQRKVELWEQMSAYLLENESVDYGL